MTQDETQDAMWNGVAGLGWVAAQETVEEAFSPLADLLVETVAAKPRRCVLDVGCGTGSTTLAVAKRLGAQGRCVGIDISEPMLGRARLRAELGSARTNFICADAESHGFESASFDMIISRFGVMFFSDPKKAFENLRRAAEDGAELCCIVWRSPSDNPFMTTAERAAVGLVPNIPARDPDAPGQFGFSDPSRVGRILEQGGWMNQDISPVDIECSFPERDLVRYVTSLGPVGRALAGESEETRSRVLATVLPAFAPYVDGGRVRFTAACWKVSARARH